ncbi:hypothetical protein [uncultured Roseobacter sp.]|uniref:hypothetical protein n=1 Tax=uncultured Roseobacter sp. TaxID=114847 RepID=UPI00261C3B84|nr:hypothetical protein [uncultured Roseobacter sp.]
MIDIKQFIDFLQVLSGFVVVGGVLDAVTKSYRKNTEADAASPSIRYFLAVYYNAVYKSFFTENPFSKRYILLSSFCATILLVFWIWIIGFVFNSVRYDLLVPHPLLGFVMYAGYLGMAWLSLCQTGIFTFEALSAKLGISRWIFIASDILVSTNLFLYLYALVLTLSFSIFGLFILNPQSKDVENSTRIVVSKKYFDFSSSDVTCHEVNGYFRYWVVFERRLDGVLVEEQFPRASVLLHSCNPAIVPSDLVVKPFEEVQTVSHALLGEGPLAIDDLTADGLENALLVHPEVRYFSEVLWKPQNYFLRSGAYQAAFSEIDTIEDELFDLDEAIAKSAEQVFGISTGYQPYSGDKWCTLNNGGIFWESEIQGFRSATCYDDTVVVQGRTYGNNQYFHTTAHSMIPMFVWVSPIFMGVITPSLIFYFVVAASFFLEFFRSFITKSKLLRSIYTTVPFSASAVLLSMFFWFFVLA